MHLAVRKAPITIRRIKKREIVDHSRNITTVETDAIEVEIRAPEIGRLIWRAVSRGNRAIDRAAKNLALRIVGNLFTAVPV